MIVVNNVMIEGVGFGMDINIVMFYKWSGEFKEFFIFLKYVVVIEVLKEVKEMLEGLKKWV